MDGFWWWILVVKILCGRILVSGFVWADLGGEYFIWADFGERILVGGFW